MNAVCSNETTPSVFTEEKSPVRGKNYSVVHTTDLIERFKESGLVPVWAKQRMSRNEEKRQYARHMIRFRRENQVTILNEVYPEVVLVNAHDGSSSVNLMAGLFRLVCSNGLIVASSSFGQETIRHSRKTAAEDSVEAAHRIIKCAEEAGDAIQIMMDIDLSSSDQLRLATTAHQLRFGPKQTELADAVDPSLFLATRRPEDVGSSLWKVFNRVQENMIDGAGIVVHLNDSVRRRKMVKLKAITGVSQTIDLNRQLWGTAIDLVRTS